MDATPATSATIGWSKQTSEVTEMWQRFEETMYTRAFGSLPILFKPQLVHLTRLTDNKHMPKLVVNEWTSVTFQIRNTLRIPLALFNLKPMWKFVEQQHGGSGGGSESTTNEPIEVSNEFDDKEQENAVVECTSIGELLIWPGETYRVRLKVRAKRAHAHLHVLGIKYKLCVSENTKQAMLAATSTTTATTTIDKEIIQGKQVFELRGARLNNNTQNMRSIVYDVDNRLNFKIINKTPLMQVEFDHLPGTLACNQLERVRVYLVNTSAEFPIGNIKIASNGLASTHICFSRTDATTNSSTGSIDAMSKREFKYLETLTANTSSAGLADEGLNHGEQHRANQARLAADAEYVCDFDGVTLEPNGCHAIDMWIKAPESEGEHKFYFMFFYQESFATPPTDDTASVASKRKLSTSQNLK